MLTVFAVFKNKCIASFVVGFRRNRDKRTWGRSTWEGCGGDLSLLKRSRC